MKKWLLLTLLIACLGVKAQTGSNASNDAERLRISVDRSRLEATFAIEETACYKRFLVNNCLDEIKVKRRDTLADLRRQEIVLNDEARKTKAAVQLQKTEDKSSPEKLQQGTGKRSQAVKDFEDRVERDKQKNVDRKALKAGEKGKSEAAVSRIKSNQDKNAGHLAKQAAAAEEIKKYNKRLQHSEERRARYAREKSSQTKAQAQPLPAPQ